MTLLSPGDEKPHNLTIETKINKSAGLVTLQTLYERGVVRHGWFDSSKLNEYEQFGNELLIWKMHTFSTSEQKCGAAMEKARDCKTLVLDLRENGGGYVDTMKRLLGYFFDKDVKIGDQKMREGDQADDREDARLGHFQGKTDSPRQSRLGLCFELREGHPERIAGQSHRRHDRLGAVMESKFFDLDSGFGKNFFFGTRNGCRSYNGRRKKFGEDRGNAGRDRSADRQGPGGIARSGVAYAAKLAGVELSPEKAGTFFPYEWPK